jgi:hypothetical protein
MAHHRRSRLVAELQTYYRVLGDNTRNGQLLDHVECIFIVRNYGRIVNLPQHLY